jgi:hypothetical protein
MSLLDRARHWVAEHPEPEIDASADADLAMVLAVFPGARVVGVKKPAVWPPQGGWIPSSARTLDPYGTAAPTSACPCCGATAWHRAGSGFTCGVCHPPANTIQVAVTDAALDATLFGLAERAGFPRLALSPAVTVLAGQDAWTRFANHTTSPSLRAAAALLAQERAEEVRNGVV